ncbi:MAG: hypothetical protein C4525_16895 [Desulfarculus sp.]|jgi:hypothetical protein|nr:MAG: hypothetical protein C4525_16895 [Desulfarculus sp.]
MEDIKRVCILVNEAQDSWEGLRSTLGLLVENLWAACFFIDALIELPAEKTPEEFQENLEMLEDLEGECYTNLQANAERFEFMKYLPLEQMVEKIKTYQLVVPF